MTYVSNSQSLNAGNIVTFMTIDFSTCIGFAPTGTTKLYWCSHRSGTADITYDSQAYEYIGFDAQGFRSEMNGQPPTPTIVFDKGSLLNNTNYQAIYTQYFNQQHDYYFDWRGAKVTVFRAINLDTSQKLSVQEYIVSQVTKESVSTLEVQLTVSLGLTKFNSDSIQTLAVNRCSLHYRTWNATTNAFDYTNESAGGCPYGNPTTTSTWTAVPMFGTKYFTNQDAALLDANKNLDKCSYSALGCQNRFDPAKTGLRLPFVMLYSPNKAN
jgi:phage-related protein